MGKKPVTTFSNVGRTFRLSRLIYLFLHQFDPDFYMVLIHHKTPNFYDRQLVSSDKPSRFINLPTNDKGSLMKIIALLLILGACVLPAAQATPPATKAFQMPSDMKNMKLGLWESTIDSQSPEQDIDPKTLGLEKMPPDQRARMEATLKRQHDEHVKNGYINKATKIERYCLKPADFQKDFLSDNSSIEEECKTTEGPRSSSSASYRMDCKSPEGPGVAETSYNVKSPTEVVSEMASKGTIMGKPWETKFKVSSRWVSADCGKVTTGPRDK